MMEIDTPSKRLIVRFAAEKCLFAKQSFDAPYHPVGIRFLHGSLDSNILSLLHELSGDVQCEKENWDRRKNPAQDARRFHPCHAGHDEIQDNNIRLKLLRFGDYVGSICCLGADLPIRMLFE
jgi:hypothetical protein